MRDPRVADVLPWPDIAGMRYIDYPRHRQLHIWLRNPEEHAAYVRAWVGTGGTGSEATRLCSASTANIRRHRLAATRKLPAAGEVE